MRKKSLPIGVLVMVFVVLLAAVSLSYGYWSEQIDLHADVTTGNLNVYWESASAVKGGTPGQASCSAAIPGGHSSNLLTITMDDLHPGATCALTARIRNSGTVPVVVDIQDQPVINSSDTLFDKYLRTLEDLECGNNGEIPAGGSIVCTGKIGLGTELNTTESMNDWATYDILVTAIQQVPAGSPDF